MIKQGIVNGSILEKKFKILRTSIMLGNIKDRNEIMSSYEEAAKEVDRIRRSEYEELLASKQYMTTSLTSTTHGRFRRQRLTSKKSR